MTLDRVDDAALRVWEVRLSATRSQLVREAVRQWLRAAETQGRETQEAVR